MLSEKKFKGRLRIFWISPILNHYKKKLLSRLNENKNIYLTVLAGKTPSKEGHKEGYSIGSFHIIRISGIKRWFGYYPSVYLETLKAASFGKFDIFMMPSEKRFFLLIFWLFLLKLFFRFKLVTFSHPYMRSRLDKVTKNDLFWTKSLFWFFDRVILYTEESRKWAVEKQLLPEKKADYANNTLDTENIKKNYRFEINLKNPKRILFIGRLIPHKRLDLLLRYFMTLKKELSDLELTVIGDGPESYLIKTIMKKVNGIKFLGTIIDEKKIADEMRQSHLVFIPENSGLSVVHAFAYGKPYVTFTGLSHGPEVSYIRHGINGYLLSEVQRENISQLRKLLTDDTLYSQICRNAYKTSQGLSIDMWCKRIEGAFRTVLK